MFGFDRRRRRETRCNSDSRLDLRRRQRRRRLFFEDLEPRCVLTSVSWDGGGGKSPFASTSPPRRRRQACPSLTSAARFVRVPARARRPWVSRSTRRQIVRPTAISRSNFAHNNSVVCTDSGTCKRACFNASQRSCLLLDSPGPTTPQMTPSYGLAVQPSAWSKS